MTSELAIELELDRVEAELAAELPGHVRALAAAYAAGTASPVAPAGLHRSALVRRALAVPDLARRALQLLRLITPVVVENDPAVAALRARGERSFASPRAPYEIAEPAWSDFAALAAARDAVTRASFQRAHVPWMSWLHGTGSLEPTLVDWPAPIEGWRSAMPVVDVERAWHELAARHGARGRCRITHAAVRPRTFVVEPGREVIVVVGPVTTAAARFAALHELGHALAALLSPVALPRMLDEAAASYAARLLEGGLDGWSTPLAAPARDPARRTLLTGLHAIEAGVQPTIERPPWGLWHDPGVQGAYLIAERFADHWWTQLGPEPGAGAFAAQLAAQLAHVEHQLLADRELLLPMQPQR